MAEQNDPLAHSPLSAATKDLWHQVMQWTEKVGHLKARRPELHVEFAEAQARYETALAQLAEAGDFSDASRKRVKQESGLAEIEEQIEALDIVLRNLPQIRDKAARKFREAQDRERRQALERLAKELQSVLKKEILPLLRSAGAHLGEVERLAAEAKRWAQESERPLDFGGYPFPASPLGSTWSLINFVLRVSPREVEPK